MTATEINLFVSGIHRGGFRAAATSKTEGFVIIVNDFQPLTIITKHSILDVAAALDPSLIQFATTMVRSKVQLAPPTENVCRKA